MYFVIYCIFGTAAQARHVKRALNLCQLTFVFPEDILSKSRTYRRRADNTQIKNAVIGSAYDKEYYLCIKTAYNLKNLFMFKPFLPNFPQS